MTTVSERELKCLKTLADFYSEDGLGYIAFKTIEIDTGFDRQRVRRSVRALARKGFAHFSIGLWTDDGEPRGSGYCCTKAGYEFLEGAGQVAA